MTKIASYLKTGLYMLLSGYIASFLVSGCMNEPDEQCACTAMECSDGISVSVRLADGHAFPEGDYTLHWKTGSFEGMVGPDSLWHWNQSAADSEIVFYIANYMSEDKPRLKDLDGSIALELYKNGTKAAEAQSFQPAWITTTCNTCTGPCVDQVSNAKIEMTVTLL